MAARENGSISATYCAAGNPYMTNCDNLTGMRGISGHHFRKDETLRLKRIHSVCPNSQVRFCPCQKAAFVISLFGRRSWGKGKKESAR